MGTGRASIRFREGAGTLAAARAEGRSDRPQSNTRIRKREAGERGARRRVAAVEKQMTALQARRRAGRISSKDYGNQRRQLLRKGARAARLSKTAGSGAG